MQFSVLAAATMAFAAISSAYTQPVGSTPSGNPTKTPALGAQIPVGKSFAVTWTPTTQGSVTLVLLRGPSTNVQPLYAIAEKIPNSGSFAWTPSTALPNDSTHYGIQIISDANGAFQYTPQFGIVNANPTTATSAASTASAVSQIGDGQVQAPASSSSSAGSLKTVTTQVVTTLTSVHTVASTVANSTVASTSAPVVLATASSSSSVASNVTATATLSPSTILSATASATSGVSSGAAGRVMAGNAMVALMGFGAAALAVF